MDRLQQQLNDAQNTAQRRSHLLNQAARQVANLRVQVGSLRAQRHYYRRTARHYATRMHENRTFCIKNYTVGHGYYNQFLNELQQAKTTFNQNHHAVKVKYIRFKHIAVQENQRIPNENHHDYRDHELLVAYITLIHVYHHNNNFNMHNWMIRIDDYVRELNRIGGGYALADDMI